MKLPENKLINIFIIGLNVNSRAADKFTRKDVYLPFSECVIGVCFIAAGVAFVFITKLDSLGSICGVVICLAKGC